MGRGLFSLCTYIKNFKNLLVRNHWTDFNVTSQKCFLGDTLPRLFMIRQKHGCRGGGGAGGVGGGGTYFPYISIYLYTYRKF